MTGETAMTTTPADWRHLLNMPREGKALVVGEIVFDLGTAVEVTPVPDPGGLIEASGVFQIIIVFSPPDETLIGHAVRLLDPENGVLLVGLRPPRSGAFPPVWRMSGLRRRLRDSGLQPDGVFAALPEPWLPEYVFLPTPAASRFAITQFVKSRRPSNSWTTRILTRSPMLTIARWWLPGALVVIRRRAALP